jgi:hypothetical protein
MLDDRALSLNIVQEKPAAPPKRTSFSSYRSPSSSQGSYAKVERGSTPPDAERKKRPRK